MALTTGSANPSVHVVSPDDIEAFKPLPGEMPQQREQRVCDPEYDGPFSSFIVPFMKNGCRHCVENCGHTIKEAFPHNLSPAMFLFFR
jgi:hypothetical protein